MVEVYVEAIKEVLEVDEYGRFELPARTYSTTELKKIARDINRKLREISTISELEECE